MGLILRLSLRNLLRQKRRNLFLGMGIAFGMMIFVIANSFSHGMSEVFINDIIAYAFGHLVIQSTTGNGIPGSDGDSTMIRDKAHILKIVKESIAPGDLLNIAENLQVYGRAIGNGEVDNIYIVGILYENGRNYALKVIHDFFALEEGNLNDFFNQRIEYPVIISRQKAKSLNLKLHDEIRVRVPMVTGQLNTAKLNVIAIANAKNTSMDSVVFMDGIRAKKLLGYKPWESASLQLTLKNPKVNANKYALVLRPKLKPRLISIVGNVNQQPCRILAFKNDDRAKALLRNTIRIVQGSEAKAFSRTGVMLSRQLARKIHLDAGNELRCQYLSKYRGLHEEIFKISAIYDSDTKLGQDIVLVNGEKMYGIYDRFWPAQTDERYIDKRDSLYPLCATEWKLMPPSPDYESFKIKYSDEALLRSNQTKMDVITMYEGASILLNVEAVLNSITMAAILVLFFIILIGVVNTLRMTIKERTREIGAVRAIGMQKTDIRNQFIIEVLLLTVMACLVGIGAGMIMIRILSLIKFDTNNALSIIFKDQHVFFKLNFLGILSNLILILLITGITAYFPAKRAAAFKAVEALRHYE
jgi:ABC-type lipoprotein release transport system permease subunit